MIIRKLTILLASVVFCITACAGNAKKIKWDKVDSMTYHFEDVHIQPELQRNYTITLTPQKAKVEIDCYGSFVMGEEFDITPEQFKEAVNTLKANGLKEKKIKENVAYSDEMSHQIGIYSEGQTLFNGFCVTDFSSYDYKEDPIKVAEVFLNFIPRNIGAMVQESKKPKEKPRKKCNINWDEVDYAEYKHSTGTVAPDFYRSYLITVEPDSIALTVFDYSNLLLRRVHPNTPEAFKAFLENCKAQGFYSTNEQDNRTGGSSEMVGFFNGNKALFKEYTDNGLCAEKGGLGQAFHAIFPEDVEGIVDSTIKRR